MQDAVDSKETLAGLDTLNMPPLEWPGKYVPPKAASSVKIKWRRNCNSAVSGDTAEFNIEANSEDDDEYQEEQSIEAGSYMEASDKESSTKEGQGPDKTEFNEDSSGMEYFGEDNKLAGALDETEEEEEEEREDEGEGEGETSPRRFRSHDESPEMDAVFGSGRDDMNN
jgi:hypothetical protein